MYVWLSLVFFFFQFHFIAVQRNIRRSVCNASAQFSLLQFIHFYLFISFFQRRENNRRLHFMPDIALCWTFLFHALNACSQWCIWQRSKGFAMFDFHLQLITNFSSYIPSLQITSKLQPWPPYGFFHLSQSKLCVIIFQNSTRISWQNRFYSF